MAVKVVVDTNVWISSLLIPTGYPAQLRRKWEEGKFKLVISDPLLDEFVEVLNRPRIRKKYGIKQETILELFVLIEQRADHVVVSGEISVCRDKDDDLIIETAIKGEATYLVTRDDDVKRDVRVVSLLKKYNISILSVAEFLKFIA
jgi:putative PIN family toxin of toxin-antitoxin system